MADTDTLMDSSLALNLDQDAMATWSEDKKKEFADTFSERVDAAQYVIGMTAENILQRAEDKQYISRHVIDKAFKTGLPRIRAMLGMKFSTTSVGGRSTESLDNIANQRAKEILAELPPLAKAIQVIDAETAKKIKRRDEIVALLKELKAQLEEYSEPILLREFPKDKPIGEVLDIIDNRTENRTEVLNKMKKLGVEGDGLLEVIHKKLYKGLPGLSDAVIEVAKEHYDRIKVLDQAKRRIPEKIKFGDSDQATQMLSVFEKDEEEISSNLKEKLRMALRNLDESLVKKPKKPKNLKEGKDA